MFQSFKKCALLLHSQMESKPRKYFLSKILVHLFPFVLPLRNREKQPNIFSKTGSKALTYYGFKSLLNHGAASSSHFSNEYFFDIWHLCQERLQQPGSRGSSHMPHMYGKGLHPALSKGGQSGSEDLPWLGLWACLPWNVFLPLPSCHQIQHPTHEKCSL